jgi:ABC-type polysaccharide/polyol phosphate transport system ATPase subunit
MTAVRLDHVSKQFTLRQERSRSFQELFLNLVHFRLRPPKEEYWALQDVSIEVETGQMVGIIGENGAGKSTLLKLLTGIIEPTSGQIAVNGRISALLELGAGFHPDLTGRENVYLNGSILGFTKADMDSVFDDILEFSEMERFIDVPVKHYSSGMYMRLGFSIAIHVRPDVLIVDEILAVGDEAFQRRCLDRIHEMKRRGVTIILVSHNLTQVRDLCDRAIWLDGGEVQAEGAVERVLEAYTTQVSIEDEQLLLAAKPGGQQRGKAASDKSPPWRWGSQEVEIVRVELLDVKEQQRRVFETGEMLVVRMHFAAHQRIDRPQFGVALYHANGFHINGPNTVFAGLEIGAIEGEGYIDYTIDALPLLEDTYLLSVSVYDHAGEHAYDHHHQAYTFRVQTPDTGERFGSLLIPSTWRMGPAGFLPATDLFEDGS